MDTQNTPVTARILSLPRTNSNLTPFNANNVGDIVSVYPQLGLYGDVVGFAFGLNGFTWRAEYFEVLEDEKPEPVAETLVIDSSPAVMRDYDFAQGDERRYLKQAAIRVAEERRVARGVAQQVRRINLEDGDRLTPPWLIQDIG